MSQQKLDAQEIDILKHLREAADRRAEARRSYEWKMAFGLWTGLGLAIGCTLGGTKGSLD